LDVRQEMTDGAGALRLTFAYQGRRVELVDVQPVDAVAPEPPPSPRGRAGFWLELTARGGRPLFRRVLRDSLGESVELPSDDPERPFERATVEDPSGTFQVMIPAVEDAEVALFHVDPERGKQDERGDELGRFDLSRYGRGERAH
jgi:hypothetical protein